MFSQAKEWASKLIPGENSPFQNVVDEATSEFLLQPDWEKNMALVDRVNQGAPPNDVLNAIRKRVCHSNPKVQVFALTILETLVRACGRPLRAALNAHKVLLDDIVRVACKAGSKSSELEVQEKAKEMIFTWNFNFRASYMELYNLLHRATQQGAVFPPRMEPTDRDLMDGDAPQIPEPAGQRRRQGRQASGNAHAAGAIPAPGSSPVMREPGQQAGGQDFGGLAGIGGEPGADVLTPAQQTKQITQLVEECSTSSGLLEEMLRENRMNPHVLIQDELCSEVVLQNRRLQTRVMQMIEMGWGSGSESNFEILLGVNDSVNKNLELYDTIPQLPEGAQLPIEAPSPVAAPAEAASAPVAQPPATQQPVPQPAGHQPVPDPFDSFLSAAAEPQPAAQKPADGLDDFLSGIPAPAAPAAPAPVPAAPASNPAPSADDAFIDGFLSGAPVAPPVAAAPVAAPASSPPAAISPPAPIAGPRPIAPPPPGGKVSPPAAATPSAAAPTTTTSDDLDALFA